MELTLIQQKIYEMRGHKVMLDFDLAALYDVETRALNQAIKRNSSRFPEDFMFRLTAEEWQTMSSQIVMTAPAKRPKTALPYAFTEHGVTMLASVLRSEKAVKMNIAIVRAFIALKQYALTYKELAQRLEALEDSTGKGFADVYKVLNALLEDKASRGEWEQRQRIGF